MPRRLDQQSLDIVSGKSQLGSTAQLLDNTLATMSHKMKQREQAQLGQLRSQQIRQGAMELSELEAAADIRGMEQEARRRQGAFALENQDQIMENELYANSVQRMESEVSAKNAATEQLLASNDTDAFRTVLEQNKGMYSQEFYETYKDVNWSNKAERSAATERMISDIKYEQDKRLQSISASASSTVNLKATPYDSAAASDSLKAAGINAEHVAATKTLIRNITDDYRQRNINVNYSDTNDAATQLLRANPDKYMDISGGPMGDWTPEMWQDKTINKEALEGDIRVFLETGGLVTDASVWRQLQQDNPRAKPEDILRAIAQGR